VREPIIETSDAALATAAAAVRTHTNNPFPVIEAHASSNDSSDTLSYTATVQQAIDTLQLLQRGQSTTPLTAQSILYIEVCYLHMLRSIISSLYGETVVC
jgi:hypothetical protein